MFRLTNTQCYCVVHDMHYAIALSVCLCVNGTFHDLQSLSVVLSQFHSVVLTSDNYTDIEFDGHVEVLTTL